MTPKEKAQELVSKFKELPQEGTLMFYLAFEISKQSALIAIDFLFKHDIGYDRDGVIHDEISIDDEFWQEVKTEIEKL
jgi:hypothetical protein